MMRNVWTAQCTKVLGAVVCFLAVAIPSFSQAKKTTSGENSLLWRVSGNGLTEPSYVFGTIHAICESDYLWTPIMQKTFDSSEKLCLELDMDDPMVMLQGLMGMVTQGDKKLSDHFTPEQYKRLEKYMRDSVGMPIAMFENMSPVVLMTMMATKGTTPCEDAVAYEMKLMEAAKNDEIEVLGLERVQEQMDALNTIPTDSVVKALMDIVDGKQTDSDDFTRMVAAYKKQDLAELNRLISGAGGMMNERGPLLDDRNVRWIPRMEEKMKMNRVFFAVGAGHLPGEKGVLTLLRKAGYTVTPMKDTGSNIETVRPRYKI